MSTLPVQRDSCPDYGADSRPARPLEWMRALPPPSKDLPRAQRDVLIQLALAMDKDGSGWVPESRLAAEAAVSADTVQRAVKWARLAGWLLRTARGHRISDTRKAASTYQLLLPNTALAAVLAPATQHRRRADPTPQNSRPNTAANAALRGPSQEVLLKRSSLSPSGSLFEQAQASMPGLERETFDRLIKSYAANPRVGSPIAILKAVLSEGRLAEEVENMRLSPAELAAKYADEDEAHRCPECGIDDGLHIWQCSRRLKRRPYSESPFVPALRLTG